MAVNQPFERLVRSVAYTTNAEIISGVYYPHMSATQTTLFIRATTAGTLDVDMEGSAGEFWEIQANVAVLANDLTVISFQYKVPGLRVRFTPSANPGTLIVDAAYGGHSQVS
jgi:hypothetical protein